MQHSPHPSPAAAASSSLRCFTTNWTLQGQHQQQHRHTAVAHPPLLCFADRRRSASIQWTHGVLTGFCYLLFMVHGDTPIASRQSLSYSPKHYPCPPPCQPLTPTSPVPLLQPLSDLPHLHLKVMVCCCVCVGGGGQRQLESSAGYPGCWYKVAS